MKIDDKVKAYGLGIISAFILILSVIGVISLFNGYKTKQIEESKTQLNGVYATVYKLTGESIVVDPIDEEIEGTYTIDTKDKYNVGDFVLIDGEDITLIASASSLAEVTSVIYSDTTTPTTSTTTTKSNGTTNKTTKKSTTTKKTSTKVTTTKVAVTEEVGDESVIAYVKSVNEDVNGASDTTISQKIKSGFITVVDFIFYDGEIKGVTWDELSTTAKAKVVYYALLADSKIDEKFPNYKETISSKYNDLKAKLIAKYLDITTSICTSNENNAYHCSIVKQDFELLKSSVSITWDLVVDAFKYGYGKTTDYLKSWYETFSGK